MKNERVGSVLHGAYGDYYEQLVALRYMKRQCPEKRLILFYANDLRMHEMAIFDHSFADEVHPRAALTSVTVDRFHQFQIYDAELRECVLSHLPREVLSKFDLHKQHKPWQVLRKVWRECPDLGDIRLSEVGRQRLPKVEADNQIPTHTFVARPTVGFLWRYRRPGEETSHWSQPPAELLLEERSKLFQSLIQEFGAHILVCGMGVRTTDENRHRTDNKYESRTLDLPTESVTYLQGLNWGLELEIMRHCSLCIVMVSGFSEALWLKRRGRAIIVVDAPRNYLMRVIWNRVPLFGVLHLKELLFQLRQPHTAERVYRRLKRKLLLPIQMRDTKII